MGAIGIEVQDATGHRLTTDKSKVKVYLTSSPTKALGTVGLKGGVGTLKSLTLKTAGTFALGASAPSRLSATTTQFTVTPGAAAKLTLSAPANVTAGQPFAATVQLFDKYKNPLATDAVALALKSGPAGGALSGATSPFSAVAVSARGKYVLTATTGKLKATSKPLTAG